MATKKKSSSKKNKSLGSIIGIVVVAVLVYYVWSNHGVAISNATGINLPPAPGISDIIGIVTGTKSLPSTGGSSSGSPAAPATPPPMGSGELPALAEAGKIRVYSFNIQIFGKSKMNKPKVVDVLVDIVSRGDVIAIQEVRADSDEPVKQFMELLPAKYDYVLGPREGRTASKEQYWVIYDTEKIEMLDSATYDDVGDRFQRSPMAVHFKSKDGFGFILIDNHIQPSDAAKEIAVLPEVIKYFQDMWKEQDVMVMGDFNADGSYYNEDKLEEVFPTSGYLNVISNEYDTTVASGDNTYDRFIITASAKEDFTGVFGVVYYDKAYDFESLGIEPKDVSDHFPVWAEFYTTKDTD